MFLYYLIIAPIEMIVEWVFYFFVKVGVGGIITAVFGVSVVINFLALPLYNIADALQDKERQISRRLEPRLKRIRKAFKGDEQFMMISTYYRQNDYHPLYVLRSSLSILIEIPFFIAAYHFLSHCPMLLGEHFWIFKDLGSPDRMWTLTLGSLSLPINILPIIMTAINVISAAVYTRGGTVKEKVQIYALAAVFLVLLYESPSGLVIYWILNNLFSLAKNVIQKMKHPKTVLSYIIGITLILAAAILLAMPKKTVFYKKIIIAIAGVIFCCLPTIINRLKQSAKFAFLNAKTETKSSKTDFFMFVFSALAMSLLLGLLLPSSVIASSPTEFSFLGKTDSPFSYIYSTFWTFLGLCTLWPTIIYLMFGHKVRRVLSAIMPSLLICVLCNVYIFKPNYGNLNSIFEISFVKRNFKIPAIQHILSVILLPIIVCLVFILRKIKKHNYLSVLILSVCIAIASLSAVKCHFIKTEYKNYAERRLNNEEQKTTISPIYHLSKDNENVIILFLDRAIGAFFPYIIKEFPELKEKFSGFTFYPNTLSFGLHTNSGFPAMAGGYEYTPDKINERDSEKLVDKHNEACMVMPKIFLDAGYDVTVTDVPWLGYQWVPDIDVLKQHGINANNVDGQYSYLYKKQQNIIEEDFQTDEVCRDKIKFFVMTQAILPAFRKSVYESGNIDMDKKADTNRWTDTYAQLHFLPELTSYDNKNKTFTFICNDAPHQDTLLDAPNYKKPVVESNPDYTPSFTSDNMETTQAYHVNISAIMAVGAWLDSLRANNVYNNSRIIIVSDHGYNHKLYQDFPLFVNSEISLELPCFANPLLMYKDFNENGELVTDYSFMTNADTIILARQNLSVSDKNPFTGKTIQPNKANGVNCYDDIIPWDASNQRKLNKFPLDPSKGWVVRDNLFDPNNWTKLSHSK